MKFHLEFSKRELAIWCGSWIAAIALLVCGWMFWAVETQPNESVAFGWSPDAEAAAASLVAAMPAFEIVDADGNAIVQANEKANVRLWHATLKVHGRHRPNIPQQGNDCTAFGAKHAIELLEDIAVANGEPAEWHPISANYIYGRSRHPPDGGSVSGEGCSGAYTARCVTEGVCREDLPDFPPYSGALARQWGDRGPPARWISEAKKVAVRQTSLCPSSAAIRDAVCNWYPVTIASNVGFKKIVVRDGRRVGVRDGQWPHQMAIVGYDGSGREPYWYVLNSWGDVAHGKPLGDEPPGGFWITEDDCEAIAAQRASFAYSSFAGFPAREFHFDLFSTTGEPEGVSPRTVRGLTPIGSPTNHERPDHEEPSQFEICNLQFAICNRAAVDRSGTRSRADLRSARRAPSAGARFALGL